jgi:hypothetical protein
MLQLNSFFEIEKSVVVRTFIILNFNGKQKSVSVRHSNMVTLTQRMGLTCSICQMHNAYVVVYKQLHLFLQLADSNAKEVKSKTKEWNDKIKQDNVRETDAV